MRISLVFIALSLAALSMAAERDSAFGPVSIAALEDAHLSVLCDGSVVPVPCEVQLEFHDLNGRTLKQANVTVQPNAWGSLDFTSPNTAEIVPCFKVLRGQGRGTLEIFDPSGRGHVLVAWGRQTAARRGDVDFGVTSITPADVARVGASCQEGDGSVMPVPCDVTFEFHDMQGRTLKQSHVVLQPGTSGFLDLTFAEAGSTDRHGEIDPCFKVARGAAVGTVAVVDAVTGFTLAHAYPGSLVR